ncbi:MAG TPA: hypothetical protein VGM10_06420 [Actinocrinis sp.]|jgi:hypothetical protein
MLMLMPMLPLMGNRAMDDGTETPQPPRTADGTVTERVAYAFSPQDTRYA